jgi:hypothetical protein
MSLIDTIKDQLTGEVTSRLSSFLGASETQTKSTLGAAIPALLSALSGAVSTGGGGKLASTINDLDPGVLEKFTGGLSQQPGELLAQGSGLLDSLLGGSTLAGLVSALSKFAGMDVGNLKKLLALVSPLVLGAISKQLQGRPATAQNLQSLFAEEQSSIAGALPAGLSLAGIPGVAELGSAASNAAPAARQSAGAAQDAGANAMKTLLPIAALALLALLGWQLYQGRQEKTPAKDVVTVTAPTTVNKPVLNVENPLPEAKQIAEGLTTIFSQATQTLRDVTDVETAEAALPKLTSLEGELDGLIALWKKVPAAARTPIEKMATESLGTLTKLIDQVQEIPGVGEKLSPTLESLIEKLQTFDEER